MTFEEWRIKYHKTSVDVQTGFNAAFDAGYRAGLERAAEIVIENRFSIPNPADAVFFDYEIKKEVTS